MALGRVLDLCLLMWKAGACRNALGLLRVGSTPGLDDRFLLQRISQVLLCSVYVGGAVACLWCLMRMPRKHIVRSSMKTRTNKAAVVDL
jgi:protein-S-isoprenylcysteine O-methyltransferase Ste14